MVLNVEGSSPFSHPKERGISVMIFLFFAIYQAFGGINRIKGQRNNLRDFIFKHIKNLGELGLKTLSLAYDTETSKTRQGQSKNCLVMF